MGFVIGNKYDSLLYKSNPSYYQKQIDIYKEKEEVEMINFKPPPTGNA